MATSPIFWQEKLKPPDYFIEPSEGVRPGTRYRSRSGKLLKHSALLRTQFDSSEGKGGLGECNVVTVAEYWAKHNIQ